MFGNKTIMALIISIPVYGNAWAITRYGEKLCHSSDYSCIKINPNDSWERLFPNPEQRDIVKRVNRMNISLRPGMTIAVPNNLTNLTIYDVSPFPRYIQSPGEKTIYVNQKELAWGAYDAQGALIWWGPLSSGSGHCKASLGGCKTPTGSYRIGYKQGIDCISMAFPIRANGENGGAEMPFCMHFFRGYALHGSYSVPGYRDSHGCVRIFIEDAQWLNESFVNESSEDEKGTRVIVDDI